MEQQLQFFLGANAPQGFISRFDQLYDPSPGSRLYILKGGPGTGKSHMLEAIAREGEKRGERVERILCSSDPSSLDAVICWDRHVAAVDGTAPHVVEPKYPGAYETLVAFDSCWNQQELMKCRPDLELLGRKKQTIGEHANRFLSAAGMILGDTIRLVGECMDVEKIHRYCKRLVQKELRNIEAGTERIRFLSTVSGEGIVFCTGTAKAVADRFYILDDEWGAVSKEILDTLRNACREAGCGFITCYSPMSPFDKIEHLFIPSIRLGFLTSNRYHPVPFEKENREGLKKVNALRFIDQEKLRARKKRLHFNKNAADQMLWEAFACLEEAKEVHTAMENLYTPAMDYQLIEGVTHGLLDMIFI